MSTRAAAPAGMTTCPAHQCGASIPFHLFMCGKHWGMVPQQMRHRINRTWAARQLRPGDQDAVQAHEKAKAAALAVVDQALGKEDDRGGW